MNQPRRLIILTPLVLLSAVLLVRARLPRPQTAGDKWLWGQAESATDLRIGYSVSHQGEMLPFEVGAPTHSFARIGDRQSIRSVLRSFKGTSAFSRQTYALRDSYQFIRAPLFADFRIFHKDGTHDDVGLYKRGKGYDLVRLGSTGLIATTTDQGSVDRMWAACLAAIAKTKHR